MANVTDKYDINAPKLVVPTELITNGDGGDSVDLATAITDRTFRATSGKPTICVSCELSASGATVAVACVLYTVSNGSRVLMGVQTATATATVYRVTASGDYVAGLLFFDSSGAEVYEIRVADPSTGTVDVRSWEI